jgi:hypothetical protein
VGPVHPSRSLVGIVRDSLHVVRDILLTKIYINRWSPTEPCTQHSASLSKGRSAHSVNLVVRHRTLDQPIPGTESRFCQPLNQSRSQRHCEDPFA